MSVSPSFIQNTMKDLEKDSAELCERLKKIQAAIKALRDVCPHPQWIDAGHDSHYSYRKCTTCNETESY